MFTSLKKWNPNKNYTYTEDVKETLVRHFLPREVSVNDFRIPLVNSAIRFFLSIVQNHIDSKMYNIVDSGLYGLPSHDYSFNSLVV